METVELLLAMVTRQQVMARWRNSPNPMPYLSSRQILSTVTSERASSDVAGYWQGRATSADIDSQLDFPSGCGSLSQDPSRSGGCFELMVRVQKQEGRNAAPFPAVYIYVYMHDKKRCVALFLCSLCLRRLTQVKIFIWTHAIRVYYMQIRLRPGSRAITNADICHQ